MNKNDRFLIVGLGLLGGSYARGLARAGFAQVYAIDTNPEAIRFAKEKGYIADGASENFEELVRMADRVIFALYPTALEGWVARYGGLLRPGCICTDVSLSLIHI